MADLQPHFETEEAPLQEDGGGTNPELDVAMVTVKVAVDEVEPHHLQISYSQVCAWRGTGGCHGKSVSCDTRILQGMTAGDLVETLVEQVGLGGDSTAYTLSQYCNDGEFDSHLSIAESQPEMVWQHKDIVYRFNSFNRLVCFGIW